MLHVVYYNSWDNIQHSIIGNRPIVKWLQLHAYFYTISWDIGGDYLKHVYTLFPVQVQANEL